MLASLLLLASSDVTVGSCAAADLAVSDALTTVHVPRVPAEATVLTVASFSTDVGATGVSKVSGLSAVVGSLLLLTSLKVLVLILHCYIFKLYLLIQKLLNVTKGK
jgi:hypothetical protein